MELITDQNELSEFFTYPTAPLDNATSYLLTFPFFTHNKEPQLKKVEYVYNTPHGRRFFIVSPSREGQPDMQDAIIMFYSLLLKIKSIHEGKNRPPSVTYKQLAEVVRIPDTAESYELIERTIKRLLGTVYHTNTCPMFPLGFVTTFISCGVCGDIPNAEKSITIHPSSVFEEMLLHKGTF